MVPYYIPSSSRSRLITEHAFFAIEFFTRASECLNTKSEEYFELFELFRPSPFTPLLVDHIIAQRTTRKEANKITKQDPKRCWTTTKIMRMMSRW
jgi:hypothetical protein